MLRSHVQFFLIYFLSDTRQKIQVVLYCSWYGTARCEYCLRGKCHREDLLFVSSCLLDLQADFALVLQTRRFCGWNRLVLDLALRVAGRL